MNIDHIENHFDIIFNKALNKILNEEEIDEENKEIIKNYNNDEEYNSDLIDIFF